MEPLPFPTECLLRREEVLARVGLSKSELYRRIERGDFPRPLKIGTRAARWRASDVSAWIAAQAPAAKAAA